MRAHPKPILMLLWITPFLTELLSNNLPPQAFFNPLVFLFLATIAYGFPVLLLREFACHKRMGLSGMICLGFIYGIFNEGILAKTFFLAVGVPVNTFDHYGFAGGISIPWSITISLWHALHSFLAPIFIVYYFFPEHRSEPWLTRKTALWLALPTVLLGMLIFFTHSKDHPAGTIPHFILMLGCTGLLAWSAIKLPQSVLPDNKPGFQLKPIIAGGGSFFVLLAAPVVLSAVKVHLFLFYGYFLVVFVLIAYWLNRRGTIPLLTCLLFTIGNDVVTVLSVTPTAIQRRGISQFVVDVVMLLAFILLLIHLARDNRLKTNAATPIDVS